MRNVERSMPPKTAVPTEWRPSCPAPDANTTIVASGGTLTRLGYHEFLYVAMAIGVSIMFAGVLLVSRPGMPAVAGWLTRRTFRAESGPGPAAR